MAYLKKLRFDKTTNKVYCINVEGKEYANFPICFNYYAEDSSGQKHWPIENGDYSITYGERWEDLEWGYYIGDPYGTFWMALDTDTGKGFHGYGDNRSLTSGTYGCIRGENADGEQICRAVAEAVKAGVEVIAEVVGYVDEMECFCLNYGDQ